MKFFFFFIVVKLMVLIRDETWRAVVGKVFIVLKIKLAFFGA